MHTGLNVFRAGHVHRADLYIAEHAYRAGHAYKAEQVYEAGHAYRAEFIQGWTCAQG